MEGTFDGIVVEKIVKKTYWQFKVNVGDEKIVTLNTKEKALFDMLNIGDRSSFAYQESEVPGTADENGNPFKMKWIQTDGGRPAQPTVLNKTATQTSTETSTETSAETSAETQLDRIENKLNILIKQRDIPY